MADRRMISRSIILSDEFIELTPNARWLYTALLLTADDDGFVVSIQSLLRQVKATRRELQLLCSKNYIICFETGTIAITHWHVHNSIKKDRYKSTLCVREKALLHLNNDGVYEVLGLDPKRSRNGSKMDPQVSSSINSIDKVEEVVSSTVEPDTAATAADTELSVDPDDVLKPFGKKGVVMLSNSQIDKLLELIGLDAFNVYVERLENFIVNNNATVQNHFKTILKWVAEDSQT